jgi:hypothetical protein
MNSKTKTGFEDCSIEELKVMMHDQNLSMHIFRHVSEELRRRSKTPKYSAGPPKEKLGYGGSNRGGSSLNVGPINRAKEWYSK